jgi:hypothetical protein
MGNMIEMTLQQAENWVEKNPKAEWYGWDIYLFTKDPSAQYSPYGVRRNGEWCKRKIIAVNERGTYVVSNNYARLSTKARNRS